ncbi:MAG TPA: hypothetical protein VE825_00660 [Terriglobales bacterium]|nr:hypothetical protein [Terriglobales bacterium]
MRVRLLLLGVLLAAPAVAPGQAQQNAPVQKMPTPCGPASQILNLAVTPKGGDPWVFVNKQADVTGTVADAAKCGVGGQQVALLAMWGLVNPAYATSSPSGQFQTTYTATATAGPQKVNAVLYPSDSGFASAPVAVHPILNSVTPGIGPVAGGQNATLNGDGFAFGNTGTTTVNFGGVGPQMGSVALQSIPVVTPHSPLAGNGDGIVDVIATSNGLDSLGVPYQYVTPGKPYISFKSTSCKTHYIVVTVYDANAQPVTVPIQLSASYPAYFSKGLPVASLTTTSGTWVQVDGGGPFTATNQNLSGTASFPVLPAPICYNIRNITKVDWHIFEKPGDLTRQEVSQVVQAPTGSAGGGLRVRRVGEQQLRNVIHQQVFLSGSGAMKTESAAGQPTGNVLDVQFAGPAFSITRAGQREDEVAPLDRELTLTFALPRGFGSPIYRIVHLTMLDGQPTWVEDGNARPQNGGLARGITDGGIYALVEVVGISTENPSQQPEQSQQPAPPPTAPQAAPPGSTVLVPSGAFPGGVLTGVVLGPDDKPVPNTPVTVAGGVPITLTGVVIGEEQPTRPTPDHPQPCQPDANGNLPPGCPPERPKPDHPAPCQPDAAGNLPPGCAPPTVNQPSDCAGILGQYTGPTAPQPGVAAPTPPAGAVPTAIGGSGSHPLVTDANGRFAMCVPVDAPQVDVSLPGTPPQSVPSIRDVNQAGAKGEPPSFFQPNDRSVLIGLLRKPTMEQGGHTWLLPAVYAISGNRQQTITAFKTPRDLQPGPVKFTFTDPNHQPREFTGGVFKILSATLDRSKLRSQEGADFEYTVQFGDGSVRACVRVSVAGPVVLVQAPPAIIAIDASGMGHFGGKIRATQVAPGSTVPFDIKPDITECGGGGAPAGGNPVGSSPALSGSGGSQGAQGNQIGSSSGLSGSGGNQAGTLVAGPVLVNPWGAQGTETVGGPAHTESAGGTGQSSRVSAATPPAKKPGAPSPGKAAAPLNPCVIGQAPVISGVTYPNSDGPLAYFTTSEMVSIHGCDFDISGEAYLVFSDTTVKLVRDYTSWGENLVTVQVPEDFTHLDQDGIRLRLVTLKGKIAELAHQRFHARRVDIVLTWMPASRVALGKAVYKGQVYPSTFSPAGSQQYSYRGIDNVTKDFVGFTVTRTANGVDGPLTIGEDQFDFSGMQPGFEVTHVQPYYVRYDVYTDCDQVSGEWAGHWPRLGVLAIDPKSCHETGTTKSLSSYGFTVTVNGPWNIDPWPADAH